MRPVNVLVVDDNPDIVEAVQEVFESKFPNAQVKGTLSGREALQAMESYIPDVVLLDIMMPDMDGWAVAAKMHEDLRLKDVPIIYVTAKSDGLSQKMGKVSSEDYIIKPFKAEDLLRRTRLVLIRYKYMRNHLILLTYGTLDALTLIIPAVAVISTGLVGAEAAAAGVLFFAASLIGLDYVLKVSAPQVREEKRLLHEANMRYWAKNIETLAGEVPLIWLIAFIPPFLIHPPLDAIMNFMIPPTIWGIYWVGYKPVRMQWK